MTQPSNKKLSIFSLVMITVVSVDSIRNLPATALFGTQLIFFYCLAAIFFLLPTALASAQLSAQQREEGGVYAWIKKAFGEDMGFFAIWLQWIENVIWYPTILAFVAGTLGYLVAPELGNNRYFLFSTIVAIFWGATFINCRGIKTSAIFSTVCSIFGLMLPMAIIIALGAVWILKGHPLAIHFNPHSMVPHSFESNTWVSLTGIALSFCGMEIATVHAKDVRNPRRAFPIALMYATAIILFTLVFGALSIAIVLPAKQISLVTGIMQAFDAFFSHYHMRWALTFSAAMLVFGGIGSVNNWIISPIRGLLNAAKDKSLPVYFCKENKHGAPVRLLMYQASIVTLISMVFLFLPTANSSYWLLTVVAAQLYMIMYILLFVACVVLYKKTQHSATHEPYFSIPGGRAGVWTVCTLGIVGSLTIFTVGFIPPALIDVTKQGNYVIMLLTWLSLLSLPPFILRRMTKKHKLYA